MKYSIEQLDFLITEMRRMQQEHQKASVYYDWEDNEIRITYPLPRDFYQFTNREDTTHYP